MFDYVIVGAGSAGCVLANRLSENPDTRVCLLEAGKPDKSAFIHMPAGLIALLPSKLANWAFETVPQKGLNGRKGYQPRGKTLGGSSSINAMVYIRGQAEDYDAWAAEGNEGWSYQDVLPYFKKAENHERGADDFHGLGGPLNVADLRDPNPIGDTFLAAAQSLQIPLNHDFNGADQEGVGPYEVTQKNGERCSAAKGYLTPILDRKNLTVITEAHAAHVVFDGKRATGVAYHYKGAQHEASASKEVILCGGAFNSPQLLMLSGVGAPEELKAHGIDVVHELPGVGKNLHDHIDFILGYKTKTHDTFGMSVRGTPGTIKALLDYRSKRQGPMTSNFAEKGGFLKSDPTVDRPDIQLHFAPAMVEDHGRKMNYGHGYSCHVCVLRPKSRGTLSLASADPFAAPLIDPNFLGDEEDLDIMVKGVKIMHRIMHAPPFDVENRKDLHPFDINNDDEIKEAVRSRADTVYHPVGTCKMGKDDMAVVGSDLKVHGLEGLRVADASIMPQVVSGNTNAPSIMIGEKCADMILNS